MTNKKPESKYAQAGVDFDKEHGVVDIMKLVTEVTIEFTKDLREMGISFEERGGDFSGGFKVNLDQMMKNGIKEYEVKQCSDSPGSKPVVHALYNGGSEFKRACTGIDSIAMVVNDLICSGARPVSALDYHAWHSIDLKIAQEIAFGKIMAAKDAMATVVGGENASLAQIITGPIPEIAYDMCNMGHGIIFNQGLLANPLGKGRVEVGDVVVGLSSSGINCNGVTLVWKTAIDFKNKGWNEAFRINQYDDELQESVAEAILTPTPVYVKPVLDMIKHYGNQIKAIANITGEGIHNMERVLPDGMGLELDYSKLDSRYPHSIFPWVMKHADVPLKEMYENYNMGTGMIIIMSRGYAKNLAASFWSPSVKLDCGSFRGYMLGEVVKDPKEQIKVKAYDKTELVFDKK